jgi:hypothetical protein
VNWVQNVQAVQFVQNVWNHWNFWNDWNQKTKRTDPFPPEADQPLAEPADPRGLLLGRVRVNNPPRMLVPRKSH